MECINGLMASLTKGGGPRENKMDMEFSDKQMGNNEKGSGKTVRSCNG